MKKEKEAHIIKESFITFMDVYDLTGRGLAGNILKILSESGFNLKYLYGQGYDGAAAMSGCFNGVQSIIREKHPLALYVHCSSHNLNLALAHSCQLQDIRNCVGIVTKVGVFFNSSAQRIHSLKEQLEDQGVTNVQTLLSICGTRWVENHKAFLRFIEIFEPVMSTLNILSKNGNIATSSTALTLMSAIQNSSFLISLVVIKTIFAYTLTLSKFLQTINIDLTEALHHVELIKETVSGLRSNCEESFKKIFDEASELAKIIDTDLTVPRQAKKMKNRSNVEHSTTEEYYRRTIYIPFLDDFLNQLDERFIKHKDTIQSLHQLLPTKIITSTYETIKDELKMYFKDDANELESEFDLWKMKWQNNEERPSTILSALDECNVSLFPKIYTLLKVLATLPVTTASAERTFSSLKRLKSYLRNQIGQERLAGLALLNIHRDILIPTENIIDKFFQIKRKISKP